MSCTKPTKHNQSERQMRLSALPSVIKANKGPILDAYVGLCGVGAFCGAGYGANKGMRFGYEEAKRDGGHNNVLLPNRGSIFRAPVSVALHGVLGGLCGFSFGTITAACLPVVGPILGALALGEESATKKD
jgi:hypothetical protein